MSPNAQNKDHVNSNSPDKRAKSRSSSAVAFVALGALLAMGSGAAAHDVWSNGEPAPAWVKKACRGPEDVHHLSPDQVHHTSAGWRVDGYPDIIPIGKELPSPDGGYWIFYRTLDNGDKSIV